MDLIVSLFHNRVLIAAFAAWALSQIIKGLLYAVMQKRLDWSRFLGDGGMPSSHSASVTAAAASCGLLYGLDSGVFAVAVMLAFITCHDAMHSRQEIGKQSAVLRKLTVNMTDDIEVALKEFVGHTPTQVIVGIALGLIVGVTVSLL